MKRLLFITFYFPPRNHVASYRSGCFAKFLPEHGWLPTVVCQDWPPDRPDSDPDFVGELPASVPVHRIPAPPEQGLYEKVLLRKLAPYLWPHRAPILWWRQARARVASLLKTTPFDAIWATSDPLTPLTLALEAARHARIPWAADIRDCMNGQSFGSWYKRSFFRRQERRLCRLADRVITVSDPLASVLKRITDVPVAVIPNGFDASLFPAEAPDPAKVFTILYAGNLEEGPQDPGPVLQAVYLCLERGLIPRNELELVFLGTRPESLKKALAKVPNQLPIRMLPRLPHRAALALQTQASVLLLIANTFDQGVMTGKIFDYLAAGRPILAVPDDRDTTAALLRATGAGVVITDIESIALQLSEWFARWRVDRSFKLARNESLIRTYSRCAQTGDLAQLLTQLVAEQSSNSL